MDRKRALVIVGDGEFGEIAHDYFTADTDYRVVAFSAERAHLTKSELFGLPVVPFEELAERYPPAEFTVFVAITYTKLNRIRSRLYLRAKGLGYRFATYISPRAFVWPTVGVGENCFVFEHNVLQRGVEVGNNVVLWSGNHVGHKSVIEDHCYISSHVVISGYGRICKNSFVGVNVTLADNVTIGRDNFVGAGCVILKDTEPESVFRAVAAEKAKVSSLRFLKITETD